MAAPKKKKKRKMYLKRLKTEPTEPDPLTEPKAMMTQEERMQHSQENIQRARIHAMMKDGFNREEWRETAKECIKKATGFEAYTHQLNTGEALALRMDSLVIAGTGAGKTIPFTLPVLMSVDEKAMVWIFSPLRELQRDQVNRFSKMGLKAVAVNGESYTEQLYDDIQSLTYRILLSGPEMALYHPRFSRAIRNSDFMSHFKALIFDEAHLIPQWGENFREAYFEVGRLRSLFPQNCPILATTATVTPRDVEVIEKVLHLQQETMYYINLGNDRPNISQTVKFIQSLQCYTEIYDIIDGETSTTAWPSTMVFANTIDEVRAITHALQRRYPERRELIDSYHSRRRRATKRKVMDRFRGGKVRILCTTEAAGMGADIPDVEVVIQWRAPPSLACWVQHAGRAGRAGQPAQAYLLAEQSILQLVKDDEGATVVGSEPATKYRKKCDPDLRGYIATRDCRRAYLDCHFDNPQNSGTHSLTTCCDNCLQISLAVDDDLVVSTLGLNFIDDDNQSDSDSSSNALSDTIDSDNDGVPEPTETVATQMSTSSTQRDTGASTSLGKRLRPKPKGLYRTKGNLAQAKAALFHWRDELYDNIYSSCALNPESVLSSNLIDAIAYRRFVNSFDRLKETLAGRWHYIDKHGSQLVEILKKVEDDRKRREDAKRERDRVMKAEKMMDKKRIEKENEAKYGRRYQFVHCNPETQTSTRDGVPTEKPSESQFRIPLAPLLAHVNNQPVKSSECKVQ